MAAASLIQPRQSRKSSGKKERYIPPCRINDLHLHRHIRPQACFRELPVGSSSWWIRTRAEGGDTSAT